MRLWGAARSAHAVTDDSPERVDALIADGALLVAVEDGAVVGAADRRVRRLARQLLPAGGGPEHRRRGIGRALVVAGEERLRALGAPRVTALVAFDDEDAGGFWEAAGYPRDPVIGRRVRTI